MSNHASTTVVITGPKEDRDRLKELVAGRTPFDLNKVIPKPATLQFPAGARVPLSGDLVIEWSFMHWGTKSEPCDSLLVAYKGDELMYRMCTAWPEPLPVFEKLKEMFPSLTTNVRVDNEIYPPFSYTAECGMWAAEMIKYLIELQGLSGQSIETPPRPAGEDVKPATIESAKPLLKQSSGLIPRQKRQSIETPPSHRREDVKPATIEMAREFLKRSSGSVPKQSTPPAAPPANSGQDASGMNNEGTTQK
jgi:hypothetical protein